MSGRALAGLLSSCAGWFAAWLISLLFQLPELLRNTGSVGPARHVADGLALWSAFTFTVCLVIWLVVVFPGSLLFSSAVVRRWRWLVMPAGSAFGVYAVGNRLGTWTGLAEGGPLNPLDSQLFWMYSLFAVAYTLVTVARYVQTAR